MRKITRRKALQFTFQFPHQRRRTISTMEYGKVDTEIDEEMVLGRHNSRLLLLRTYGVRG